MALIFFQKTLQSFQIMYLYYLKNLNAISGFKEVQLYVVVRRKSLALGTGNWSSVLECNYTTLFDEFTVMKNSEHLEDIIKDKLEVKRVYRILDNVSCTI